MAAMRTTIDLPDDIHQLALAMAHDRRQTLSQAVTELVRRGLGDATNFLILEKPSGLRAITLGRPITSEDVKAADDE